MAQNRRVRLEEHVLSQDEGRRVGLTVLEALGYNDELYRTDYPVWLGGSLSRRADFVAFGRKSPLDMTTATAVIEVASKANSLTNSIALARALAAPLVVMLEHAEVSLHRVTQSGQVFEYARLASTDRTGLRQLSRAVGPSQLLQAKLGHRQLGLFPVDIGLLDSARRRSEQNLGPLVEAALETAAEMSRSTLFEVEGSEPGERLHKQAARIVVGALTALALRDKEDLRDLSPAALADTSQQRYSHYFRWLQTATPLEHLTLEAIISALGDGVDYRSLDPRVLATVYENSLVSDAHRKALGTHYTPSSLARVILQSVPLEDIRPENRLVLDPTCGSGGLLLAAHDRLRELQPQSADPVEAHAETVAQLRGLDKDDFAVELARLSLLLNAYPASNGWHIRQADVLETHLSENETPSVIVANPPWRNTNSAGARQELADRFLHWMIESLSPNGFIAVVLPVGWLNNRNSRTSRRELQQRCDLFEVWRLPESVFDSSGMAPAVLFAQKKEPTREGLSRHLFKRVVRPESLPLFYSTARADETSLSNGVERLGAEITGGLLIESLDAIDTARLETVANVVTGPQPKPGVVRRTTVEHDTNALLLPNASSLDHLSQPDVAKLVRVNFPEDFQGGSRRGEEGLGQPKVLVSAARSAENPWRLKVGFDLDGVLARNSLQMVIPRDPGHLLGIMAFLASTFSAAWIDETVPDRNISTADIRSIPVPDNALTWRALNQLGSELIAPENRQRRTSIMDRVDDVVWTALNVKADLRRSIEKRFQGFRAPDGVVRFVPEDLFQIARIEEDGPLTSDLQETFGATLSVRRGEARLVIAGLTEEAGMWMPPPAGISGWMLRPGSTFNAEIPSDQNVVAARFSYQSESWLADDELEEQAFELFDVEDA